MRSPRAALLCGSFAAAALAAVPAVADPPPVKLVEGDVALELVRGPGTTSCPDEAALRERAADGFDFRDPFVSPGTAAAGRMRIEITHPGKTYVGIVSTLDANGEAAAVSTEQHVDCDALVWVLAHRIALAITRRTAPPAPAPTPAPTAPPAPTRAPAPSAPPARACGEGCLNDLARRVSVERVRFSRFSAAFAVGSTVSLGFTGDGAPGVWGGAALQTRMFSFWFEVRGVLPNVVVTFDPSHSSQAQSISGVLAPCMRWKTLSGCLFAEVGQLVYQLPDDATAAEQLFVSIGPRAALDVPLFRGFALRLVGDLALHPLVSRFSVRLGKADDAAIATWETPIVSGIVSLGLAWSS